MALSPQEEQELAAIESELQARQSPQSSSGLTQEEEFELAQIEQELAARQQNPQAEVNPKREADLGFFNRARYALEPLESNRKALLVQEFGEQNVQQDDKGNIYVRQGDQFRPVNKEGLSFADATEFAGALPEMAGSAAGMIMGGTAGAVATGGVASIPAAIKLGAVGGGLGSLARQGISALAGTPQVATIGERVAETGMSAGISGLFAGGGQALKVAAPSIKAGASSAIGSIKNTVSKTPGLQTASEVAESTTKATKSVIDSISKNFSVSKAADADEFLKIADDFGIDKSILPESVEYGEKSFVSRLGRVVAEGPSGEERLNNFAKAQMQVSGAIDGSVSKLSPYVPTSRDEAGQFIVDSINEASKDFFGSLDETYGNLVKNAPGLKLSKESQERVSSKLLGLERFAKGRIERGIGSQKQEARSLLEAVSTLRNSKSSLKQTVEALKNIGEEAFKKGGQNRLPIDKARLQGLYFDLQKEVIETVRGSYGDDVADNLIKNNKMITDFLGENSVLSKVIGKEGIAPEKVFQSLIENGDTRKIEALVSIMPPDKVQSIKGAFLNSLIKRNNDGFVLYDSTINNLKGKKEIISKLFKPEELEDVGKLLKFGKRMGNPIMSTSGTGASNAFNDFVNTAKSAVFNETTLDLAKKKGSGKLARPPIKNAGKSFIPKGPGRTGSYGNILFDSNQRQGAYFVRGPYADKEQRDKSRNVANEKKK